MHSFARWKTLSNNNKPRFYVLTSITLSLFVIGIIVGNIVSLLTVMMIAFILAGYALKTEQQKLTQETEIRSIKLVYTPHGSSLIHVKK